MRSERETTLGELTVQYPSAAKVFHAYGLDYCCGGRHSLADACREKSLDPERVLAEVGQGPQADPHFVRWESRPSDELIDFILTRYHAQLRDEIPRLIDLAITVEQVHAGRADCPKGLAAHLNAIGESVEAHLAKEEQVLFPLIRNGRLAIAAHPVRAMMLEHEDHGQNLRKVRELTRNLCLPDDACATWHEMYRSLEQFEKDLMDHIHLENNVLFPRVLNA